MYPLKIQSGLTRYFVAVPVTTVQTIVYIFSRVLYTSRIIQICMYEFAVCYLQNMSHEVNILQLSSIDEENHDGDKSQRDLFEELKTWRKEYARSDLV